MIIQYRTDTHREEYEKPEGEPCANPPASEPLEDQEIPSGENDLPGEPAKVPHSPGTVSIEKYPDEESSHVSNQPGKEKETEPYLPDMVQGNTTNEDSDSQAENSETNMHPFMPEYSLADESDLPETSPVHTENQNDAGTVL